MRSTQDTLLEEGTSVGSGLLMDLDELDLHLSILASKDDLTKTPTSTHRSLNIYSPNHTGPSTSKGTPRTESEIIVRIDGMEYDMDSPASAPPTQDDHE
jgi:hypothetical protein